jgi:hypothetical protein
VDDLLTHGAAHRGASTHPVSDRRINVKGLLNSNLKLWHLVVLSALVVVLAGGAVALSASSDFWNAGSVRLDSAYSDDTISIEGTDNPPVRVLRLQVRVPSHKVADIQATFTADLHHNGPATYAYCFGTITLDGTPSNSSRRFQPGQYQLLGGATASQPDAVSVSMSGVKKGVGPGYHYVNVYVSSAYAGCTLFARTLNVVATIR